VRRRARGNGPKIKKINERITPGIWLGTEDAGVPGDILKKRPMAAIIDKSSYRIDVNSDALIILDTLHRNGFQAYVVGGCVRDALIGLTPHDWDICTDAVPDQVRRLFGENHCIPTGIQHGTVTVHAGSGFLEVTTFRTEGSYSDGRHPDSVSFIRDVREDLARRDFTVNAMAYSPEEGLIDPFGGVEDLLVNHVIRAVGDPAERFSEDALRIMRFYRFAARLDFALDPATEQAALRLAPTLEHVSAERIRDELVKTLLTRAPSGYLPKAVLRQILPELALEEESDFQRTMRLCDLCRPKKSQRLAALFSRLTGSGVPEERARRAMRKLRFSNEETDSVTRLVRHLAEKPQTGGYGQRVQARLLLRDLGEEGAQDLTELWAAEKRAGSPAGQPETENSPEAGLKALIREMAASGECVSLKQLALNGKELMEAYPQIRGKEIGETLSGLLDDVIRERTANEKSALLEDAARRARAGRTGPDARPED
jgi:tRNA nucleotidyltransferase (CCA-adding enzyme)